MSTELDLVAEIAKRDGSRNVFGYGIGVASHYMKSIAACAGDEACIARSLGAGYSAKQWETMLKEAESRPTYCNDEMVIGEEKATSVDDFKTILAKCKGEVIPEVPKHCAMVFQHFITTTKMDRDRDILESDGAEVDPRAPFLWQHIPIQPIGKLLGVSEQNKKSLKAVSCLLDINDLCGDAIKFVEADVLRISHGFKPKKFEAIPDDAGSQIPNGFRVKKFEVVEVSGVSVPANSEAIITMHSRKQLKNELVKAYAQKFYDARPTVVGVPIDMKALSLDVKATTVEPKPTEVKSCSCGGSPVSTSTAKSSDDKPKENEDGMCSKCGEKMKDGKCKKCDMKAGAFMLKLFDGGDGKLELRAAEPVENKAGGDLGLKMYASVEDSYEWIRDNLQGQVKQYLKDKEIIKDDPNVYNYCYIEATRSSDAVVCVSGAKQAYYLIAWKKTDGIPKFSGDPKEVQLQAQIVEKGMGGEGSLGRRLAFATSKAARVLSETNVARLKNALDYQSKATSALNEIKADHDSKMKARQEREAESTLDPVESSPVADTVSDPVNLGKSIAVMCLNAGTGELSAMKQMLSMLTDSVAELETKQNEDALNELLEELVGST